MKVFYYLILLFIGFSYASEKEPSQIWTPEFGISFGSPAPILLSAGLHYQFSENVGSFIRAGGLGIHSKAKDFWCGARGSLGFSILRNRPYFLEAGMSLGYFYAQAPNLIHQSFNKINNGYYLYEYNRKEFFDVSAMIGIHLWGIHIETELPLLDKGNTSYSILWRVGYIWSF